MGAAPAAGFPFFSNSALSALVVDGRWSMGDGGAAPALLDFFFFLLGSLGSRI